MKMIRGVLTLALLLPAGAQAAAEVGSLDTMLTQGEIYVSASYKQKMEHDWIDQVGVSAMFHDFTADHGGDDYGSEWGASVWVNIKEHYKVGVKYADYNADDFLSDVQKLWLNAAGKFLG